MKVTCGTDIIEISRIKSTLENGGEKLKRAIFTEAEIEYCESKKTQKFQHYAGRFAAKEAVFKALSKSKYVNRCNWKEYEILNDKFGRPEVHLKEPLEDLEDIDISISHCKEYATANVVVIFKF